MRRTPGLTGLIGALAAFSSLAQPAEVAFGDLVAAAGEQMAVECELWLNLQPLPNELANREAEMSAAMFCDCMPPALQALGRDRGAETLITGEEFGALVLREFDICGARTVRDTTRRDCAKFTPPNAPPTYCACFSTAVDGLTDTEIVEDSLASRDNLEQRAAARRDSIPEPPLREGLLARIDMQCKRPPPAP
jgi:hypothetical protein